MRPSSLHLPLRVSRLRAVAAIVAVVVAVTGFVASAHGHVSAPDGATAREPGFSACSICHLAHETAAGPVALPMVSAPLRVILPPTPPVSALALLILARDHAPRAPPCAASC